MADSAVRRYDVETMFNLTYRNYQVLPRPLLRSAPPSWQDEFAAVVGEMRKAFAHIPQAGYYAVIPADERTYDDLTEAERRLLDVDVSDDGRLFYDRWGDEYPGDYRVMVPCADGDPALRHQGGAEQPGITELFADGNPDYLVLARVLLQSMPLEWQYRFTALVDSFEDAVAGIEWADSYDVIAAVVCEGAALREGDPSGWLMQLLRHGRSSELVLETQPRLLLPLLGGDPVPHYDRNRAYVQPRLEAGAGAGAGT